MVLPAYVVDCCLSSLRAGVLQSSVAAADSRAGIDGRLSSPPSGGADGFVHRPVFRSILAYSRLSFG